MPALMNTDNRGASMKFNYSDQNRGTLSFIQNDGITVPFREKSGPSLYIKDGLVTKQVVLSKKDESFVNDENGISFSVSYGSKGKFFDITVEIENSSSENFSPTAIGLKLGIDSYMESYPEWNKKYFPTFMRCERTHFTGYMCSPLGCAVGIVCTDPVAAWEHDYNTTEGVSEEECDFGHRIYTTNLLLTCNVPLPERHPVITGIGAGEKKTWHVSLFTLKSTDDFYSIVADAFGLPVIDLERYTYSAGEISKPKVKCCEKYEITLHAPSGKVQKGEDFRLDEYGHYTLELVTQSGKCASAVLYSRHNYEWYMRAARKCAVTTPQKATTHTESWYGWFSAFLAKKHYPDEVLDKLAKSNFDEVAPLMFDFDKGVPTVIQSRVQNLASFIGVLVDLYESDPKNCSEYLEYADKFSDELMKRQTSDGVYRRNGIHYTSVIYIAKSMLELALCEKQLSEDPIYRERYEKHYASAKAAVDELALNKEKIGTEGEHTLEDGMISCSALQLGFFALTLPMKERKRYIDAAEYLMRIHACLEQKHIPDARMRGSTLRFWEAQYDVMIRGNMMNSPHGWTSWKNYATYYLYLLTGKREYLIDTINTMGACLSCVAETGEVRWAFVADPCLNVKVLVPDECAPVEDGLKSSSHLETQAYRGKFEYKVFGECYVPMISSWYRTGGQLLTGGYKHCPLIYDDRREKVDTQGGACDNDVHEHFKCLEETLLKKCFIIIKDGEAESFGCNVIKNTRGFEIIPYEECDLIHVNSDNKYNIIFENKDYPVARGFRLFPSQKT